MLEKIKEIIAHRTLCLNCLGRLYGGLLTGLSNEERGKAILIALSIDLLEKFLQTNDQESLELLMKIASVYGLRPLEQFLIERGRKIERKITVCEICRSIFSKLDEITEEIIKEIGIYDFDTFMIGVSIPAEIEKAEDEFKSRYRLGFSESLRNELSREIGKLIAGKLGKKFARNPDLTIIVNPYTKEIRIRSRDIIIEGIARIKGDRVFSSVCKLCRGRGCSACNFLGRIKGEEIEYVLGKRLLELYKGQKWSFSIKWIDNDRIRFRFRIKRPVKRREDLKRLEELREKTFEILRVQQVVE